MINRNFTLIWLGKIISQLGDKFYAIALSWWILQKTKSPSIMGLFLLVSVLPGLLVGLFAGALTDRWQRKTILISADLIRGFLILVIAYLSYQGSLQIGQVFLIGFGLSLANAFFDPASQAIIPEIVAGKDLTRANSLNQMVGGICTVIGPLLGAAAVSMLGLTWVFLANSISFFISALLASLLVIDQTSRKYVATPNIWVEIGTGLAFIKNHPKLVFILKIIAVAHLLVGCFAVSLPFLAKSLAGKGVANLGYLEMMMGAGLILGSLLLGIAKNAVTKERVLLYLIAIIGMCFIIISIGQLFRTRTVIFYMVVVSVIGACISLASVFWQSLLQKYTPSEMTGRVFGIATLLGDASLPVAYGGFGILLNFSSIALLTGASGVCLLGICGYLYGRK